MNMYLKSSSRRSNLLVALCLMLFLAAPEAKGQIGDVIQENKVIVGSARASTLQLPFIEYSEVTGMSPYYTLWYWDDTTSDRKIKALQFHATDLELDYLYKVLKDGFSVSMQRIEIGESRLVTRRPLRSGNPLKINIYYEDNSVGTFYLKEATLEPLLGNTRNPVRTRDDLAGTLIEY
ncbi:hypothetical protein [Robiginitalea aurantiaca]|uniref:Uncharacterized protein n=1 Tax=Robiginitalea aurantiaca TaxID=3056915 RepID=A0ABT7WDB7_9FLAO|nr:hypothetical protein [Robiginitalea aurantiaca]MDM9630914.1 hypothetical protein [Robiginitalea aurantiaca]